MEYAALLTNRNQTKFDRNNVAEESLASNHPLPSTVSV